MAGHADFIARTRALLEEAEAWLVRAQGRLREGDRKGFLLNLENMSATLHRLRDAVQGYIEEPPP